MDWKALLKAFTDALTEATKDLSDEDKAKKVAEATNALPQEARQHLHDAAYADGVTKGKADAGTDTAAKDRQIAKLEKDVRTKDGEIEQLRQTNPEVAEIKRGYETRLTEKDGEITAAKEQGKKDLADERRRGVTTRLTAGIGSKVISEAVARGLAADPELAKRVAIDDDGKVTVYQADGKTPLALQAGQDAIDGLVADVTKGLDKSLLKSNADGGSGATGGGGAEASEFDAIRDEVKAKYGRTTPEAAQAQRDRFDRL